MTRDNGFYDNLTKSHTWITRVDWSPGSRDSLSFRFELSHATVGLQTYPDGAGLVTRDYSILTNWSRTFSANLINQLRVQIVPFNKADNVPNLVTGSIATLPADLPGSLTIAGFAIGGFVPSFTFGSPAAIPYLAHQKRFQFEDTLSWTRGRHILKFGASYRPVDYHVEDDLYFAGQFNFADNTFPLILAVPPAQRAAVVGFNLANKIRERTADRQPDGCAVVCLWASELLPPGLQQSVVAGMGALLRRLRPGFLESLAKTDTRFRGSCRRRC